MADDRIDLSVIQDLINAVQPMLAEANAALTAERDALRAAFRVNMLRFIPGVTHADIDAVISAALNAGKEVMPDGNRKVPNNDIGPGDQAVAGTALPDAVQAQIDAAREAGRVVALIEAAEMLDKKHRGDLPKHILSESGNWVRALIRKGDQP